MAQYLSNESAPGMKNAKEDTNYASDNMNYVNEYINYANADINYANEYINYANEDRIYANEDVSYVTEVVNDANDTLFGLEAADVTMNICMVVLSIAIVILNTLSIVAILKSRELREQATSILLAFLSLADLLVASGALFMFGEMAPADQRHAVCLTCALVQTATVGCSYMSLILVAMDRYLSITKPLRYHAIVTPARSIGLMVILWIMVVFWTWSWVLGYVSYSKVLIQECTGTIAILPPALHLGTMFSIVLVVFAINMVQYGRICCISRDQQRRIAQEQCVVIQRMSQYERTFQIPEQDLSYISEAEPPTGIQNQAIEVQTQRPADNNNTGNLEVTGQQSTQSQVQVRASVSHNNVAFQYTNAHTGLHQPVPHVSPAHASTTSRHGNGHGPVVTRNSRTHRFMKTKKELRFVRNMVLVMLSNLVLAIPYFSVSVVTDLNDDQWGRVSRKLVNLIIMANSAVNPLIHTWANTKYRNHVKKLLASCFH